MELKAAIIRWMTGAGMPGDVAGYAASAGLVLAIAVLCYLADVIARRVMLAGLSAAIRKSGFKWDDILLERKVFTRIAHLAPALVVYVSSPLAFPEMPVLVSFIQHLSFIYMAVIVVLAADSFLTGLNDIAQTSRMGRQLPVTGFIQAAKIVLFFVGGLVILSGLTDKTPLYFLSGLGALTAVLMLVFKDPIMGFVAGVQLSANRMVRKGDWISMPQYGADGDVLDVSLTTVKVRNWDKTITTIPTYALISNSFRNWRGMQESGGRRIKRAINIDMSSIRFCDGEMLERLSKIQYIREYIERKEKEIQEWNASKGFDSSSAVNGRRLTNVGTFRAYVDAYLKNHPGIRQDMTFLVRQLAPTEHGLPLEVYVFTNDTAWASYEGIQADIFDHLLAALPEFGLRVFQRPTGADFSSLAN